MHLKILNEDIGEPSIQQVLPTSPARFNTYLINNNPITSQKRQYVLEVQELPYSFEGHPKHKLWTEFLEANPHVISNFDTSNAAALDYLFERYQLMHNNA